MARAVNIDEIPEDTAEVAAADGIASMAAVPMTFRGRLLGVLGVASEERDRFSPADVSLLGAMAGQVATAVENALLFKDLQDKTGELAAQNSELAASTRKISLLIASAEKERSFSVRFDNPDLAKCWEVKNCNCVDCPSYKSENLRCWQVAGTHCGGEVQGVFAQKFGKCEKCEVYKMARSGRLAGLGEAFNNMMAMLEQQVEEQRQLQEQLLQSTKLAALGELAANIAHEINNPLTGVLGYAALLQRGLPRDDPSARNLKVIENETIRARDIVRNLLDFARQEGLKKRKSCIRDVMDDTLALLRKQADLINVKVVLEYDEEVPQVYVDVNQMKQVFINILNNALHAMESGGDPDSLHPRGQAGRQTALGRSRFQGHGFRHRAREARPGLRSVLHQQGRRRRHRSGSVGIATNSRGARGFHRGRQQGRRRLNFHGQIADSECIHELQNVA